MKFINKILEQHLRKQLDYYHSQADYYYHEYKFKKEHVEIFRKATPTWMGLNSHLTPIKRESEIALNNYRYWHKKFKRLKKKLNNI